MANALHPYLRPYRQAFELLADPVRAKGATAYMRHQFTFYGMPVPETRQTVKALIKKGLPAAAELDDVVRSAWAQPQREFQYAGIWLVKAAKKDWDAGLVPLIEFMITHKSWWDTVDSIAGDITGPFFIERRALARKVCGQWNRSENFWLQRSSLLFLKSWRSEMDTDMLVKHILHLSASKEFFVQKAIGWVLRDHARVDPGWVKAFVKGHSGVLPALSKREALRHIGA